METKQLILLKVTISKHENHRLKMVDKDFKALVENKKFNLLTIEFDDNVVIDFTKSISLYLADGTLAQKGRISSWIERKGYLEKPEDVLLLFELTINEKEAKHAYRFLEDASVLYNEITNIRKGSLE